MCSVTASGQIDVYRPNRQLLTYISKIGMIGAGSARSYVEIANMFLDLLTLYRVEASCAALAGCVKTKYIETRARERISVHRNQIRSFIV